MIFAPRKETPSPSDSSSDFTWNVCLPFWLLFCPAFLKFNPDLPSGQQVVSCTLSLLLLPSVTASITCTLKLHLPAKYAFWGQIYFNCILPANSAPCTWHLTLHSSPSSSSSRLFAAHCQTSDLYQCIFHVQFIFNGQFWQSFTHLISPFLYLSPFSIHPGSLALLLSKTFWIKAFQCVSHFGTNIILLVIHQITWARIADRERTFKASYFFWPHFLHVCIHENWPHIAESPTNGPFRRVQLIKFHSNTHECSVKGPTKKCGLHPKRTPSLVQSISSVIIKLIFHMDDAVDSLC